MGLFRNWHQLGLKRRQRWEGARFSLHVNHKWHLAGRGVLERATQVFRSPDCTCVAAAGAGDRDVVDRSEMADIGVRAKAAFLGIDLEPQLPVVEHDDRERNAVARRGFKLRPAMGKTTISGK